MDHHLEERLAAWRDQIKKLKPIEADVLLLEASEKVLWHKIFLSAEGKNNLEREAATYTHPDWVDFIKGLAVRRADYLDAKRILEWKSIAYQAEYGSLKLETQAIRRGSD